MKSFAAVLLLLPIVALAHDLAPVKQHELASVLGLLEELTTAPPAPEQPYIVRIFAAPSEVGECGGTVESCPDVRLFITVSSGDLGEMPVLYQLPVSKGWEFSGWSAPTSAGHAPMAGFVLRTSLPGANIEPSARKAWRSQEYRVLVSPASASYIQR